MNEKQLIVFDIDGTLTNSNHADAIFFEQAISDALGFDDFNRQWHHYKYSTDAGILTEMIQAKFKRDPATAEIEKVKECFVSYLEEAFAKDKMHCHPIQGATSIFDVLFQIGWDVALATGGWKRSAELKLKTAEIPYQHIPIAHSDDHWLREEIISLAIERSKQHYQRASYSKIIYVGDRHWDKQAAFNLGIGFIGIGAEFKSELKQDFLQIDDFREAKLLHYLSSGTLETA